MSSQLIELNSLVKNDSGVWINPDAVSDFDYSDGSNEEQYLADLFESTQDLSLDSPELAAAIQDWASLYHLSSTRANLLRNIKLPECSNILELGCGCGAITRYFAESGHNVTAVEGSLRRAEIAKLRNSDINQVEVICQNFNSLELPQKYYDAVLFIGVLEYAKRFSGQDKITPEQAVISLLKKTASALKTKGFIIITIENRTGLKYELGALEDHLAIANVGLDDYKGYEFTGVKTYDYTQWQNILTECGLANRFYYPFPDYKLPNLVICNDINIQDARYLSTQIQSNDPISSWQIPQPEQTKWLDIMLQKQLAAKANSFGIVATKEQIKAGDIFLNSWSLSDTDTIKPNYRLDLNDKSENNSINFKQLRRLYDKPGEVSKSLLNYWLETFAQSPNQQTLSSLAREFLSEYKNLKLTDKLFSLDQIMLPSTGATFQYAKYWQLDSEVSAEKQLFHLLLDFCINQKKILAKAESLHFSNIEQVVTDIFDFVGFNFPDLRQELVEFEQSFHNITQLHNTDVEQKLATIISNFDQYNFDYINSQLFFAEQPGLFNQDNSISILNKQISVPTKLSFKGIASQNSYLRFDACDHIHGYQHYFSITDIQAQDSKNNLIKSLNLVKDVHTNDLEVIDPALNIFKVDGIDPQIVFSLPEDLKSWIPSYNLAILIQWLGK